MWLWLGKWCNCIPLYVPVHMGDRTESSPFIPQTIQIQLNPDPSVGPNQKVGVGWGGRAGGVYVCIRGMKPGVLSFFTCDGPNVLFGFRVGAASPRVPASRTARSHPPPHTPSYGPITVRATTPFNQSAPSLYTLSPVTPPNLVTAVVA